MQKDSCGDWTCMVHNQQKNVQKNFRLLWNQLNNMILQEKSKIRLKFLKTMGTTGKASIILASFSNYLSVIFS